MLSFYVVQLTSFVLNTHTLPLEHIILLMQVAKVSASDGLSKIRALSAAVRYNQWMLPRQAAEVRTVNSRLAVPCERNWGWVANLAMQQGAFVAAGPCAYAGCQMKPPAVT